MNISNPWVTHAKMLDGPRVLVVVFCVVRRHVARFEPSAQETQRTKVALTDHRDSPLEKEGGGDAYPLLVTPLWNQSAPV